MKEIWIARLTNIRSYFHSNSIVDGFYLKYADHYIVFHSYGKGINHKGRTKEINWKRWNSRNIISIKFLICLSEIEPLTSLEKVRVEDLMKIVDHYKNYYNFDLDPKKFRDITETC